MLSKVNRLQKKKDIDMVFKKGWAFKENFLILKTVKNNLDKTRFCFIISKKVSPKASLRNKLKRKLSELVRIKLKKTKPGQDVLLIASPGLETKDFWEAKEILDKLLTKSKLIN